MQVKYSNNLDEYKKKLNRAGIAIQEVGAIAINKAADIILQRYKATLKKKIKHMRNPKFTLGAAVVFKAHAKGSSGKLRKMSDINAIVGVRRMRDGEHYLYLMEVGGTKDGNKNTQGKVQIPLLPARGGNINKSILPGLRLNKKKPEVLPAPRNAQNNPRAQYAMLYDMARRGVIQPGLYQTPDAVFKVTKRKVQMIRKLQDQSIKIKSVPMFGDSITIIDQNTMSRLFAYGAEKKLAELS